MRVNQGFSWFFLWWKCFVEGILRKIPMGTGGVLDILAGLGNCIEIFGGRFGWAGCNNGLESVAFGITFLYGIDVFCLFA